MSSHGPSLGLTGSFKRTLWFSSFCKAVFTFSKKNTFSKPSEHHGTRLWSLLYITKVQGTLMDLHGPPNGPCEADFGGPLPIKDPPRSKLNFFLIDLKTTDKLKDTAWLEVNRTFGCREENYLGHYLWNEKSDCFQTRLLIWICQLSRHLSKKVDDFGP